MYKEQDEKIPVDSPDFVASLAAGMSVLLTFDENHSSMTLSEVAERAKIDRAKARRYLLTLHALGYVHKSKRQFSLTPKTLSLGASYLSGVHHHDIIQFYLERVTEKTGESCSFAVLDDDEVVYIARSAAEHRLMSITLAIGTRLPAAYTSMGRAILASLPDEQLKDYINNVELCAHTPYSITDRNQLSQALKEAKDQQYVVVNQELDTGLLSLALPVYKANNELIGAINISTNALRISHDVLIEQFLPILRDCAAKIQAYYI
ncbi:MULTISPECIES: IclR family transcriptional regulator C-terminal domain-containing protein [unclassified Psychrobacter]|uniref:IclR family transcriptional regulator domain-containing protein n=1 Tax=unclassified Psychrobacter TaxID=196806 RepID=UPI00078E5E2D|nr:MULTISPECIES: IclR family transcriptional regulator C-terminal domain-containing protein [unclassified Psychrobacter]AMN49391.1 IclR family transcriptional regulator [Psychrobacter sp. P2G3]AMN67237.1 IclR family transcriptional regulator [Psychrobacter sp. P11G5]